jgi:hypothetical protein
VRYKTGIAYGLGIKDSYAYLTTNSDLVIIDIANPKILQRIGRLIIGTPIFGLKVLNQKAFLAVTDKGLVIVDVSNPGNPKIIGEFYDGGEVQSVGLTDQYCITSDYTNGLNILDISNLSKPAKVSCLKYNRIKEFIVTNNLVFLVDIGSGLKVVDISDKTNPVEVTAVNETKGASSVEIDGNRLFLGFFDGLIKIFDISNPKSPVLLTKIECPGEVLKLTAADNYLSTNFKGVLIIDISDLNKIVDVGSYRRTKGAHDIVYRDRYVYYVLRGLTIFKIIKLLSMINIEEAFFPPPNKSPKRKGAFASMKG